MTDATVIEAPLASARRFQLADFNEHGAWMLPRMLRAHRHLNDSSAFSWLRSLLNSNEHCFLYQPRAVCVFELVRGASLAPDPVVWERFAWCRDPKDKEAQRQALSFYDDARRWAESLGAGTIIVGEATDVPVDDVKKLFGGRLFSRQQQYVKVR